MLVEVKRVLLLLVSLLFPVWMLLLLVLVFVLSSIVGKGGSPKSTCIRAYYETKIEREIKGLFTFTD